MKVAIIPARGGSKRIPRKNIIDFCGKPMIAYSIEAARESGLFERVIVSTDDPEISEVAKDFGAEVPFFRPPELSNDTTGTTAVMKHAINWLGEDGTEIDYACCLYATAPFIQIGDLKLGLELVTSGSWQFVFSATTFDFPIFRGFTETNSGAVKMVYPDHYDTRSQDLPEVWHDAGQFYWGSADAWRQQLRIFESWSTIVRLPRWRVQDIDTRDDLERARHIFAYLSGKA